MTTGRINQVTIVRAFGPAPSRPPAACLSRRSDFKFTRSATAPALKASAGAPSAAPARPSFTTPGASAASGKPLPPPNSSQGTPPPRHRAWHREPQQRDPGPKHQPLRRPLRAGFPPLLSEDRAPQKASNPPNPSGGAREAPRGVSPDAERQAASVRRAPWGAAFGRVDDEL